MKRLEDGTTYIITGDIPAMWLRDSVAQIRPYLMAAGEDKEIADMLVGLVRKQFFYVNLFGGRTAIFKFGNRIHRIELYGY